MSLKVKTILVTQPKPETDKSPYYDLAKKFSLKIDLRPFIQVEPIPAKDFRKDKVNLAEHTAVILTSRNAADHFFRVCNELRVTVPETLKYFCISESTAYYLQKFVVYRKRKIFFGKQTISDLMDVIKKHKKEKFLVPCTDIHKQEIFETLDTHHIDYTKAVIYRTVASDLSDLANVHSLRGGRSKSGDPGIVLLDLREVQAEQYPDRRFRTDHRAGCAGCGSSSRHPGSRTGSAFDDDGVGAVHQESQQVIPGRHGSAPPQYVP